MTPVDEGSIDTPEGGADPTGPPDNVGEIPAPDGGVAPPGALTTPARRGRWAVEWLVVVLVAVGVAFSVRAFVVQSYFIPSASMEPTLQVGDRILVDKLSYRFHGVGRSDIVVFATPPKETDRSAKDLVKRVIGLPGDVIWSSHGRVYIDGRPLAEPFLPPGTVTQDIPRQKVPPDEFFVMGDNRSDSQDSRFFGPIPRSLIVGHVVLRIWPLTRVHVF